MPSEHKSDHKTHTPDHKTHTSDHKTHISDHKTYKLNDKDHESKYQQPSVSEIIPNLFISNEFVFVEDKSLLSDKNVGAVISMITNSTSVWDSKRFTTHISKEHHLWIQCADLPTQNLLVDMHNACKLIDNTIHLHHKGVIVHCELGISRSPTMVIAYLMWKKNISKDEALELVKSKRKVKPNRGFLHQLDVWQEAKFEIWEDKDKTKPKAVYENYLADRAVELEKSGLTGNEPVAFSIV